MEFGLQQEPRLEEHHRQERAMRGPTKRTGLIVPGRLRRRSGLKPVGRLEGGLDQQLGPRRGGAARGRLRCGKSFHVLKYFDVGRGFGSEAGEALRERGSPRVVKRILDLSPLLLLLEHGVHRMAFGGVSLSPVLREVR